MTDTQPYDDDVNLFELISKLWQEKTIITAVTLTTALAGLIYVLASTPVYEANAQLQAPTQADMAAVNNS